MREGSRLGRVGEEEAEVESDSHSLDSVPEKESRLLRVVGSRGHKAWRAMCLFFQGPEKPVERKEWTLGAGARPSQSEGKPGEG